MIASVVLVFMTAGGCDRGDDNVVGEDGADSPDPCKLFSPIEVMSHANISPENLKKSVEAPFTDSPRPFSGLPGVTICEFTGGGPGERIMVGIASAFPRESFEKFRKGAGKTRPVEGVGTKAFWIPKVNELAVLVDDRHVLAIWLSSSGIDEPRLERAKRLAAKGVTRLD